MTVLGRPEADLPCRVSEPVQEREGGICQNPDGAVAVDRRPSGSRWTTKVFALVRQIDLGGGVQF